MGTLAVPLSDTSSDNETGHFFEKLPDSSYKN